MATTTEKKVIDASKAASKKDATIKFVKNECAGQICLNGKNVGPGKVYTITSEDRKDKTAMSRLNHALKMGMVSKAVKV